MNTAIFPLAPTHAPAHKVRRIHPLAVGYACVVAIAFAFGGMALTATIYGIAIGVPMIGVAIFQLALLGRYRNGNAIHPTLPMIIITLITVMMTALVGGAIGDLTNKPGAALVLLGIIAIPVTAAIGLWTTTEVSER